MCPGTGSYLRPKRNHQSGERFSDSITSDCLVRLEGGEKTSFSEQIIREVSGIMFAGKFSSRPRTHVPHSWLQLQP